MGPITGQFSGDIDFKNLFLTLIVINVFEPSVCLTCINIALVFAQVTQEIALLPHSSSVQASNQGSGTHRCQCEGGLVKPIK